MPRETDGEALRTTTVNGSFNNGQNAHPRPMCLARGPIHPVRQQDVWLRHVAMIALVVSSPGRLLPTASGSSPRGAVSPESEQGASVSRRIFMSRPSDRCRIVVVVPLHALGRVRSVREVRLPVPAP